MSTEKYAGLKLLTVCGSLQARSANRAALRVAARFALSVGATLEDFEDLAEIPAFNPDRAFDGYTIVDAWRRQVGTADAVLIAAPEYAGAVAGALKNAVDWLVGSGEMYRRPVAVVSAGTTGGFHARRMMAQTLTWQGAYVVAELGIAAPRTKLDENAGLEDQATIVAIECVARALLAATRMTPADLVKSATQVVESLGIDVGHVAPAVQPGGIDLLTNRTP